MALPAEQVNPIYRRAGLAAVASPAEDVSQWVVDETEKVVRGVVRRCAVRASRLVAAAVLALTLGVGAADAVGQTYASWSDSDVYGNAAGAGVWTIDVDIDVVNTINLASGGLTQVKVFGSDTFDPATIDVDTVCFGSAADAAGRSCDVVSVNPSGPGSLTIMLHFTTSETGILAGDTSAVLTGTTYDGMHIFGIDTIRIAPAGPRPLLRMAPEPEPEPTGSQAELLSQPAHDALPTEEASAQPEGAAVQPAPDALPTEEASEEPVPAPTVSDAPKDQPVVPAPVEEPTPAADEEPLPAEPVKVAPKPTPAPVIVPDVVGLVVPAATRDMLEAAGVDHAEVAAASESVTSTGDALAVLERLCADLLCAGVRFEEQEAAGVEPGVVLQQSLQADSVWTEAERLVVTVAVAPHAPDPAPTVDEVASETASDLVDESTAASEPVVTAGPTAAAPSETEPASPHEQVQP